MNVIDELKHMEVSDIKIHYANNCIDAAAAMFHITGDFNLGSLIRSANFFGFAETIYIGGPRSYDRRSTVGTHHYIPTRHIKTTEEFVQYVDGKYSIVCVENNIPDFAHKTVSLFDNNVFFGLKHLPIFVFGEEQRGIDNDMLNLCQGIITIPTYGTVRSINVTSCASTVFAFYRSRT